MKNMNNSQKTITSALGGTSFHRMVEGTGVNTDP